MKTFLPLRLYMALLVLAAVAPPASAGDLTYDRILIPIAVAPASAGAAGSAWSTLFKAYNAGSSPVENDLPKDPACLNISTFCPNWLYPGYLAVRPFNEPLAEPGFIAHLQAPTDGVWFNLLGSGVSALGSRFSFEIPVVREKGFFDRGFYLIGVPIAEDARVMLRIYDLDSKLDARVRVRAHSVINGRTVAETVLTLNPPAVDPYHNKPGYVQALGLRSILPTLPPPVDDSDEVELEIVPETPGLQIWGFISITNSATLNVRTIVPR